MSEIDIALYTAWLYLGSCETEIQIKYILTLMPLPIQICTALHINYSTVTEIIVV